MKIERCVPALLLATVLGLGVYGMGRSLWLDETWVANSVHEPSLGSMFRYPGWLQINPPLFLLLVRAAARATGASNVSFRLVPLILACIAAAAMLAVSRRLLPAPLAMLASAIVVLDPTLVEYSRTLKPFTGEVAASAILLLVTIHYLDHPDRRRFTWLLVAVALAIPLAYPSVFLLPGIALAVAATNKPRALTLTAVAGAILLPILWFQVRPNLSPALHDFWKFDADSKLSPALLLALLFCLFTSYRMVRMFLRGERSLRLQAYVICLVPCLLLAASASLGLYPVSHRTRLFVLPCFLLLAGLTVQDLIQRFAHRKTLDALAIALTFGLIAFTAESQIIENRAAPEEDFSGAIAFLEHHTAPSDLILVHACCKEGFLLYSSIDHWNPPNVVFGDTGWPCCARGKDAGPNSSSEQAVFADLDAKVPPGYSGRIWLLYTTRPTHWSYTGLNEGELWRKHIWDRGCPPGPYLRFANLALSPMNCRALYSERGGQ